MEEKGLKITLATIQSFLVILLAYLLSFVKETEIVNTSVIILFILHFFIFYISDYGHDFYASQTFLDEDNNRVLIGWMYVPDSSYTNPTIKFGYQNCLTVPRVVNYKGGKVRQTLHKSVKDLLGNDIKTNDFNKNTWYYKQEHGDKFEISVDDFKVSYDNKELKVSFGTSGYGRDDRKYKLDLENVEIVFDSSSIELFANEGSFALSTRFYPENHNVNILATDYLAKELGAIEIREEN